MNNPLSSQSLASDYSIIPKRQKGDCLSRCRKVTLSSNLFSVKYDESALIYIYFIHITPKIIDDSTKKVETVLNLARRELAPFIGSTYEVIC